MMKIYCDRCGEEITGIPLKMLPTACQSVPADVLDELLVLKEPLRHKVFCKGCIAEIAVFALDRNACDECVEQMMEENAMLREPDPDELDLGQAQSKRGQYIRVEKPMASVTGPAKTNVVERGEGGMGEKEIVRYLFLVDRRLDIIGSGINWKPEYEEELEGIDRELARLRELVDAGHVKREYIV